MWPHQPGCMVLGMDVLEAFAAALRSLAADTSITALIEADYDPHPDCPVTEWLRGVYAALERPIGPLS